MPVPVFLFGISPRCGTNYLFRCLVHHKDITASNHNGELYYFYNIHQQNKFVNSVCAKWNAEWGNDCNRFVQSIGDGLNIYLKPKCDCKLFLTKTPSTKGMSFVQQYLPNSKVLLLIRDGRDVSSSYSKTFKSRYEDGVRTWLEGAKDALHYIESDTVLLTRYEDLVSDFEKTMRTIFDFLGVDCEDYDYSFQESAPVIGSSRTLDEYGKVSWIPDHTIRIKDMQNHGEDRASIKSIRFSCMAGRLNTNLGYKQTLHVTPFLRLLNLALALIDFLSRAKRKALSFFHL